MKTSQIVLTLFVITTLLSACGPQATPAPTVDVSALSTAAASTVIAGITQTVAAFTPTPQPTATETLPPTPDVTETASPTATAGICDDAQYITDVSIPDGYDKLTPGQEFVKTWRLKNIGTCTWTTVYQVVYGYNDKLGSQSTKIGVEVPPGAEVEISITLVAPSVSGTYKGFFRMANEKGEPFGEFFSVQIVIP